MQETSLPKGFEGRNIAEGRFQRQKILLPDDSEGGKIPEEKMKYGRDQLHKEMMVFSFTRAGSSLSLRICAACRNLGISCRNFMKKDFLPQTESQKSAFAGLKADVHAVSDKAKETVHGVSADIAEETVRGVSSDIVEEAVIGVNADIAEETLKGVSTDIAKPEPMPGDVKEFIGRYWGNCNFFFIGAAGIAVRYIAPWVKDKYMDSAVLLADEKGRYVIPLLSGHIGGAAQLAGQIAPLIGAKAVQTTATDVQGKFAVDVFAKKHNLAITDRELAKHISAAVLEGEPVGLYVDESAGKETAESMLAGLTRENIVICKTKDQLGDFLPGILVSMSARTTEPAGSPENRPAQAAEPAGSLKNRPIRTAEPADSLRNQPVRAAEPADERRDWSVREKNVLRLVPRRIVAGIGCRRGVSEEELETGLADVLAGHGLDLYSVAMLVSIDRKKDEPGICRLAEKYHIPFRTWPAEELKKAGAVSTGSDFVEQVTGVDNVCERSAICACPDGRLISPKCIRGKMTAALVLMSPPAAKKISETENADVVLFAGTTEGRLLAEFAAENGIACLVSTATEYGKSLLDDEGLPGIRVRAGKLDEVQIEMLLNVERPRLVIDATHPYAVAVTENIRQACKACGVRYIRCLREADEEAAPDTKENVGNVSSGSEANQPAKNRTAGAGQSVGRNAGAAKAARSAAGTLGSGASLRSEGETAEETNVIEVDSVAHAVDFLASTDGNILVTTGSGSLEEYTRLENYRERCFVRVLSAREALDKSLRLGFAGKHLIAMQGPFSVEMNIALIRQTGAAWFVTKESGRAGGFREKVQAAAQTGAKLLVIGRPKETGMTLADVCELLKNYANTG